MSGYHFTQPAVAYACEVGFHDIGHADFYAVVLRCAWLRRSGGRIPPYPRSKTARRSDLAHRRLRNAPALPARFDKQRLPAGADASRMSYTGTIEPKEASMETGKTDRRVQYTKRALTSALIDLMRENHISKISVKALCAAADVNRSTFYAHFRNQYDLLAYIEAEALEDLKARLLADGEPRTRNVEKILEYAKENADVFLMLLDESEGGFQRQIMELAHLVDLQMSDQDAAVDADDLEYMYLFAVSGALGMLSHWLKKGTPQSPAEMSELLMSMIQHGVEERA